MKTLHTQATLLFRKLLKLERSGRYDDALAELRDIWKDTTTFPDVANFEPRAAAEIVLRCGSLIGFLGHTKQILNSQEKSKNLLSEARTRFLDIYDVEKIAECENYLALAYWRTGELVEADTWIEQALLHNLPNSNKIRLYSFIIKCLISFQPGKYDENISLLKSLENDFVNFGCNNLKGDFYNHYGLNLRKIGKLPEALKKYKLAKQFHIKSGHQTSLATIENNTAYLYKAQNKFAEALEAINNATRIFNRIKDKTREGFSLDTKAQIHFAERKLEEALKTSDEAIAILAKSENKVYLVESYLTKAKTLIYLDDNDNYATATLCLSEAIQVARVSISEEAAKDLVRQFEKTKQEKISPVVEEIFAPEESLGENLELVLPPEISHYSDFQGIWIKNNHLEEVGLRRNSLAIVVQEEIKRGDLVAIAEIANDSVSCGFYDSAFGLVCVEGDNAEVQLFDDKDVRIIGKIVGVCKSEKSPDGKMIVEAIKPKSN
jgi:tetratricopeptide (TPR) repeat protein